MDHQYKNQHVLKMNREIKLREFNNKCSLCGGFSNEVHHADFTKDNHETKNLLVVCRKCHMKLHKVKNFLVRYGRVKIIGYVGRPVVHTPEEKSRVDSLGISWPTYLKWKKDKSSVSLRIRYILKTGDKTSEGYSKFRQRVGNRNYREWKRKLNLLK